MLSALAKDGIQSFLKEIPENISSQDFTRPLRHFIWPSSLSYCYGEGQGTWEVSVASLPSWVVQVRFVFSWADFHTGTAWDKSFCKTVHLIWKPSLVPWFLASPVVEAAMSTAAWERTELAETKINKLRDTFLIWKSRIKNDFWDKQHVVRIFVSESTD